MNCVNGKSLVHVKDYPIKISNDRFIRIYKICRNLKEKNDDPIRRCATYQYSDIHQIVNKSPLDVNRWIKDNE